MSDQIGGLLERAQGGDQRSLAQLLTWAERVGAEVLREAQILNPKQRAFRIGITGPPGAGKSTLVGHLIAAFRAAGLRLGVLAVDPSSPFTHGAILGDRIRYSEHTLDSGVFIRSLGTRGSLGGLSASAYLMLRIFDACSYDVVLVETVGVGQTELDIMHVADEIVVVLVPESGDSVQAMKAGLLEIADLYVVNKSDRPGAESLVRELEFVAESAPAGVGRGASGERRKPAVLSTVATAEMGIEKLAKHLLKRRAEGSSRAGADRLRHEALALLRQKYESSAAASVGKIKTAEDLARVLGVGGVAGKSAPLSLAKSKPRAGKSASGVQKNTNSLARKKK